MRLKKLDFHCGANFSAKTVPRLDLVALKWHEFHFEIQERKIDRVEGNIKPWNKPDT